MKTASAVSAKFETMIDVFILRFMVRDAGRWKKAVGTAWQASPNIDGQLTRPQQQKKEMSEFITE